MKIVAMPMIGSVKDDRLGSLQGCHAITERKVVKTLQKPGLDEFSRLVGEAFKELLLADRVAALDGKLSFILTVETGE